MKERLNEGAFENIIKKIILYLISSQLIQVCDTKTDTFWRTTPKGISYIFLELDRKGLGLI